MIKKIKHALLSILTLVMVSPIHVFAMDTIDVSIPITINGEEKVSVKNLTDESAEPQTILIKEKGEVVFQFDEPGTYEYMIEQIPGTNKNTTYDDTKYHAYVFVEAAETDDNRLIGSVVISKGNTEKPDKVHFENKKIVEPVTPKEDTGVTKTYDGYIYIGFASFFAILLVLLQRHKSQTC